jgi:putative ABC transport system substrate-binding protein
MNVVSKCSAFMVGVGIVISCAALAAQQRSHGDDVPRIGYIGMRPLSESAASMQIITALKEGLADLGYVEGRDYVLEIRIANNDPDRYRELTGELTERNAKLIVAASTPAAVAIHKANPTMPIVVRGPDIVGAGLAKNTSHPGGVATGIDELADGISQKRLRLLKQAAPTISRVAVLSSAPTESGHRKAFAESEQAATDIGVTLTTFRISETTDLSAVFSQLIRDGANAVFCSGGILSRSVQRQIVQLAARHRLPAMYPSRDYVDLGGLMSYAYRSAEMFRAAATYVDRILKGQHPGDLPLTVWDRHYLTVNARTAATLDLTIPQSVLSQAEIVK